jgi:uroporphyrinogen-III synthase
LAQGVATQTTNGEVYFFCGNQRRPELPQALQAAGLTVEEYVVYTTHAVPHKLESDFNGILFFSPSAVRSFFAVNPVSRHTVLFAIGQTTARELGLHCSNKVVTGHQTSKQQLALMAIDYFAGQNG